MRAMHCPPPPVFLEHETGLFYEWKIDEFMNEWMSFPKKPLRQRAVGCQKVGSFPYLRESDLLWGLTPRGKLTFTLVSVKDHLPALPHSHTHPVCIKIAAVQVKTEGMPALSSFLKQRGCEGHIHAAPWSQRGHGKQRNRRITRDRAGSRTHDPLGVFTTTGLRMASEPKKDLFYIVKLSWYHHAGVIVLAKLH